MAVYELINPSDPYTFEAPDILVAGVAVCMLSSAFGANRISDDIDESTPVIFGWQEWLDSHGIDAAWVKAHRAEIADALDSFLIGDANGRVDVQTMLAELPEEKREAWRAQRQDRHRTSMNKIGEGAYVLAKQLRDNLVELQLEAP
jgi:hypothetical protein